MTRPSEADVRALMERIKPSIVLSHDEKQEMLSLCEDWLRLKKTVDGVLARNHFSNGGLASCSMCGQTECFEHVNHDPGCDISFLAEAVKEPPHA